MKDKKFKYDVAFSFLKEDEQLAITLNDLVADRLTTFLYSKKQADLAGTDGEKTFNKVFSEEARVAVVLYRSNWGKTPWTKIEETAIRNRAYDNGYDFVTFILLDDKSKTPKWLPKTQIWVDLERWGPDGAASIIEARVKQEGGESREESVHDYAARIKRQIDMHEKRKQFLGSIKGANSAKEEVKKLLSTIETLIKTISSDIGFSLKAYRRNELTLDFCGNNRTWIGIDWVVSSYNTLDGSFLIVSMTKGPIRRPNVSTYNDPVMLLEKEIKFTTNWDEQPCWKLEGVKELFSTKRLAEFCVKLLIEKVQESIE